MVAVSRSQKDALLTQYLQASATDRVADQAAVTAVQDLANSLNEARAALPISSVRRRQWRLLRCSSNPVVPTFLKIEIRLRLRGELPRLWRV